MSNTTTTVRAVGATSADAPLSSLEIPRREPTAKDVQIEVLFCGVCHSDLHMVRDEWNAAMPAVYPVVPGHEIVGRVTAVGSDVTQHAVGDLVGVGCLVDSDGSCRACKDDLEQLCMNQVQTYNSPDPHGTAPTTYGGYSQSIVVDEHFVLRIPQGLDPAGAAPLLCAGITTYAPLKRFGAGPDKRVAIVGLGGLGHMGVKFAHALGAHTTVLTTSPGKTEDAKRLGADEVVISKDAAAMEAVAGSFDMILDTVAAKHDIDALLGLLKPFGTLALVGAPDKPHDVSAFSLIMGQRNLAGSMIGGIAETQEMLDFCGEHGITSDVEVIRGDQVNEAYERMLNSDVRYRFSIDISTLAGDD